MKQLPSYLLISGTFFHCCCCCCFCYKRSIISRTQSFRCDVWGWLVTTTVASRCIGSKTILRPTTAAHRFASISINLIFGSTQNCTHSMVLLLLLGLQLLVLDRIEHQLRGRSMRNRQHGIQRPCT